MKEVYVHSYLRQTKEGDMLRPSTKSPDSIGHDVHFMAASSHLSLAAQHHHKLSAEKRHEQHSKLRRSASTSLAMTSTSITTSHISNYPTPERRYGDPFFHAACTETGKEEKADLMHGM